MGNSEAKKKQKEEQQLKKMQEKQKLISVATIFLGGKDLEKVSDTQKKIFLRRKGLTEEMVQQAYRRFNEKQAKEKQSTVTPTPTPQATPEPTPPPPTKSDK